MLMGKDHICSSKQRGSIGEWITVTLERKTLALGVCPELTLAKARRRRDKAREQLANDIGPSQAKRDEKQINALTTAQTFDVVARQW